MKLDRETYPAYVRARTPGSPCLKNSLYAFLVGGLICCLGQGLTKTYTELLKLPSEEAGTLTAATLVLVAAVLTALGCFDRLAKHAGAGTLVPITGFANAVVSSAIDAGSEGMILGVGSKIFTVAGPVLLYSTLTGTAYGVVLWLLGRLSGGG